VSTFFFPRGWTYFQCLTWLADRDYGSPRFEAYFNTDRDGWVVVVVVDGAEVD